MTIAQGFVLTVLMSLGFLGVVFLLKGILHELKRINDHRARMTFYNVEPRGMNDHREREK